MIHDYSRSNFLSSHYTNELVITPTLRGRRVLATSNCEQIQVFSDWQSTKEKTLKTAGISNKSKL